MWFVVCSVSKRNLVVWLLVSVHIPRDLVPILTAVLYGVL